MSPASDPNSAAPARRPLGGPVLQDAVTEAIALAFFEELAAVGYGRLSIEAVAKRAGAGKAAVYRRWPSKQAMAVDLITKAAVDTVGVPDTGSLRGDLRIYLSTTADGFLHPLASRIIPDMLAAAVREPTLAEALRHNIADVRRKHVTELLQRGIERRELPGDLNIGLALDFLIGPLYWRLIVGDYPPEPDSGYFEELTDMLLHAFRTAPGAPETSRRKS
ncbi:TetR/AcrR family transcriptional regulator C-terminal ligand-binding domain-containing protein [Streptomyces sp. NBC_01007]|nr:TetR/AcrR family transcriptional regulator C-terminal ligand-binding domain-containing protein [Streptomyces sp. NBC_01007]WRZ95715.1 TetR/AcrR family transcriptional regulator C-terminal ligand-binding domain-containing protein [Streptomyces sp. NBC_01007]